MHPSKLIEECADAFSQAALDLRNALCAPEETAEYLRRRRDNPGVVGVYARVFSDILAERERVRKAHPPDGWGSHTGAGRKAQIVLEQAAKFVTDTNYYDGRQQHRQRIVELAETCCRWVAEIDEEAEEIEEIPF